MQQEVFRSWCGGEVEAQSQTRLSPMDENQVRWVAETLRCAFYSLTLSWADFAHLHAMVKQKKQQPAMDCQDYQCNIRAGTLAKLGC